MSEQSQILSQMQEIIMKILKSGQASPEEGLRLDELEEKLHQQKCFEKTENEAYDCKGEEIAYLFFTDKYENALEKMCNYKITPESEMFTQEFVNRVAHSFVNKC